MKTKNENKVVPMYRQGDVGLVRREGALPKGLQKQEAKGGRLILAYGEVTGHHHSLAVQEGLSLYVEKETGVTLLEVAEALAAVDLEHQEHATIPVAPGVYEVRIQREYHPQEIRRVLD